MIRKNKVKRLNKLEEKSKLVENYSQRSYQMEKKDNSYYKYNNGNVNNINIFEGNNDYNHGDIGCTYIVDAMNGIGGQVDWFKEESFFRTKFQPRILNTTTEDAFYNFFVTTKVISSGLCAPSNQISA